MIPDGNTACDRRLPLSPAAYRLKAFSYPTGFKKHEVFNVAIIQYIHGTHSGWTSPGSSNRGPFVPCGFFTRRFSGIELDRRLALFAQGSFGTGFCSVCPDWWSVG